MTLLLVVPSRGRPSNVERLLDAVLNTATDVDVILALDESDPTVEDYPARSLQARWPAPHHPTMIEKVNSIATAAAQVGSHDVIGFMGDDHLPRSKHWDRRMIDVLDRHGLGIAYGNDLFQGVTLPTAVFMQAELVRRLGWMALPTLRHLFCDNVWLDLGRALGSCTYLPNVVIEHLHPHAGKAEVDEQYDRVNGQETWDYDHAAYLRWRIDGLPADVERVKDPDRVEP